MSFSSLNLSPSLLKSLEQQKYKKPFPIQEQAIPAILERKDILGIAKTGSGKTASYVLPILQNLQRSASKKNRFVDVLVLLPTRELTVQVESVFSQFAQNLPIRVKSLAVYGGASINPQMMKMQGVNVLVATPGRLIELVESNAVHLSEIETLVLDEADKMLSVSFKDELNRILEFLPKRRQNLLFSATLSDKLSEIENILLRKPVVIKIKSEEVSLEQINQLAYFVTPEKKGPLLRYIIKKNDIKKVLIFASSTYKADNIADKLRKNGIEAEAIHGKKSQGARMDVLRKFKSNTLRVLVTTDLLARGIDIVELPYVINYELPRSPKDYIHRIGRTGRANAHGEAISLITPEEEHHFKIIQKKMGKLVRRVDATDIDTKGF